MTKWTKENMAKLESKLRGLNEKRLALYPDLLAFVKRVADGKNVTVEERHARVSEARELVRRAEEGND